MRFGPLVLFLVLVSSVGAQADEWFCTTQTSERLGNEIRVCGVSVRSTEESARSGALKHGKEEFDNLCNMSSDCMNHEVVVTPERTECFKEHIRYHGREQWGYKCNRLISFTIGELKSGSAQLLAKGYDRSASNTAESSPPKIYKGMSKKKLFATFGLPDQVMEYGPVTYKYIRGELIGVGERKSYLFKKFEIGLYQRCWVDVVDGQIDHYSGCKPEFLGDL